MVNIPSCTRLWDDVHVQSDNGEGEDRRLKYSTGPWTILHYLIVEVLKSKGYILYYQQPDLSKPEETADRYYQLTVSG